MKYKITKIIDEKYENCSWCGERFKLSDLQKEKDLGYLCKDCIKEIKDHNKELFFEDSNKYGDSDDEEWDNINNTIDEYIDNKKIYVKEDENYTLDDVKTKEEVFADLLSDGTIEQSENGKYISDIEIYTDEDKIYTKEEIIDNIDVFGYKELSRDELYDLVKEDREIIAASYR